MTDVEILDIPRGFDGKTAPLPALVFDGLCGFCTWTVDFLGKRLREPVLLVPWQRIDVEAFGLSEPEARRTAWWIDGDGRKHGGHLAVARALRGCGLPWRALGAVLEWPLIRRISARVYELVSRNRRHLPGTEPAVQTHDETRGR